MGMIRQLPPAVINQIAAGEVVERPASVVKELLENAIDAGASRVELAVERGGKDLVRVADNGRGIDRDDLLLAFQPHATSKLEAVEDLARIRTLGFRGEALAAIAEVSKVRCQSRTADAAAGAEVTIEGGVAGPVKDCGGPPGTVMEVRNLFFNTPVRRTFLKADGTEAGHVTDMFARIALAHPTVHLTFRSGGKVVYDLPPVTGFRERIAVFFGRELADALLWVESEVGTTHVWGYVGHPSQSRPSAKWQFLFLGGRYVRDRALTHALSEAYRGLLMVGRMPVAFLCLELPPEEVDVNVHPTKIEVRFRDSHQIYSQLLAAVRQTFLASDLHGRLQSPEPAPLAPEPDGAGDRPAAGLDPQSAHNHDHDPGPGLVAGRDDRQRVASWFQAPAGSVSGPSPTTSFAATPAPPEWAQSLPPVPPPRPGDRFDEFAPEPTPPVGAGRDPDRPGAGGEANGARAPLETLPGGDLASRAMQVHDSYLVVETSEGMVVIDQHALHERILYEEFKARMERGAVESQRLLVPEPVDLNATEAALVLERREELARLGLEIEPFGGDTVLVASTPAMLPNVPPGRLLRDLADHLRSRPLPPTRDALVEDLLSMVACKAAVKAGQRLSPAEIGALLERRHLVSDTHHCPHGRPTALVFTKAELERQFGRT